MIWKLAASAPDSVSVSVPSASSVTAISATLIALAVLVFSAIDVVVLLNATAVGASFTSVTFSVKFLVRSGVDPTAGSSTLTVTL